MRTPRAQDGAVLLLVALSLTVLLGMAALVADLGQFRAHRRQLQTVADAGALAGALQLPPFSDGSNSCTRADAMERQNTNLTDGKNMVVNGNLSTSYCEIIGGSVRVKPVESSVPYIFGQVLGFASTTIDARARARVVYLTRSTGLLPFGVEDLRPEPSVTCITRQDRAADPAGRVRMPGALRRAFPTGATPGEASTHSAAGRRIDGVAGGGRQHQQDDRPGPTSATSAADQTIADGHDDQRRARHGRSCRRSRTTSTTTRPRTPPRRSTSTGAPDQRRRDENVSSSRYDGSKYRGRHSRWRRVRLYLARWPQRARAPVATTRQRAGQDSRSPSAQARTHRRPSAPVSNTYARDDGDILQQWLQTATTSTHRCPPTSPRRRHLQARVPVLVKGRTSP